MTASGVELYAAIVAAAAVPTLIWRVLGVLYASRLEAGSVMLDWVRAVATALIAALVARMLLEPPGALAESAALARFGGAMAGAAMFLLVRRSIAAGVATAVLVFLALDRLM